MNISYPDYYPDPVLTVARRIDAQPRLRKFSKWMVLHLLHHCVKVESQNRDLLRRVQRLEAELWLKRYRDS